MTPERKARVGINALWVAAGLHVCDRAQANSHAATGVAIRELPLARGVGFIDSPFCFNGRSWGLIEVRKQGAMSAGVELQSGRYAQSVVDGVSVANLQRVEADLKPYECATIASLPNPDSFDACASGTIADIAISLDNMRKLVNKLERSKRPGNIPYLGANGQTGWIDVPLFVEELVLVVEDETFVGRTDPFRYYFADPCWVNNHTHVLRARPEVVSAKYLNLALSCYPFIPLTTGSTGRRKLTKAVPMTAPISVSSLKKHAEVINELDRCLSIANEVEAEADTNLQRAQALRLLFLAGAFASVKTKGTPP